MLQHGASILLKFSLSIVGVLARLSPTLPPCVSNGSSVCIQTKAVAAITQGRVLLLYILSIDGSEDTLSLGLGLALASSYVVSTAKASKAI